MLFRPKIAIKNDTERLAWIELIRQIKKAGVVNYSNDKSPTIIESDESLVYELKSTTINTKEKLIKECNIDTSIWDVSSFRVSTWQQKENGEQLFSVRCVFKEKKGVLKDDILKSIEKGIIKRIKPKNVNFKGSDNNNTAIINIFDAHIDKVTLQTETGEHTTIQDNVNKFYSMFKYLLKLAAKPERIIFPIGNDFFNVNDSRNTTKKGTPQDTNVNFIDAFEIGLNLLIDCIDKAAEVSKVYIPIVAGNHAEDLEYILGVTLENIYKNVDNVHINYSRQYRKYYQFGKNLFMFAHGDKIKNKIKDIPQIMATEEPNLWANSKFRYAIFGDIHHEQTHDLRGVKAMFLRSISHQDKWHHAEGYFSTKTAYLHIFSDCGHYSSVNTISL